MLKMDDTELLHYVGGLFTMNLSSWNVSGMDMEIAACENCGYTEFFSKDLKKRHEAYLSNKEQLEELLNEEKEQ